MIGHKSPFCVVVVVVVVVLCLFCRFMTCKIRFTLHRADVGIRKASFTSRELKHELN